MHMDRPKLIRSAADQLENILKDNDVPRENPEVVSAIERIARSMNGVSSYSYEKAAELSSWADIYYSARKHQKYPGGARELYRIMLYVLIGSMRDDADMFENNAKDA